VSSDDAGALVRKALQLSHLAADGAADAIRGAERDLERARGVAAPAVQAAAQEAVVSARHAEGIARDAIVTADRAYQVTVEEPGVALPVAQRALKLSIYARKLVRHVSDKSEAVQAALEEAEGGEG